MYEGFDSYDDYINSLSDGYANKFNGLIRNDMEFISNQTAYEMIYKAFGGNASIENIRNITDDQIQKILNYINDPEYSYEFTKSEILECFKYAVWQSVGKE